MLKYVNAYNSTGSYKINDYRFLAERLDSMEASYAQGDIDTASIYRLEMAQEIVGMYADNGSFIELEDAYALVDYQYTFMSNGETVKASETKAKIHNSNEEILNNDELSFAEKVGHSMGATVDIITDSLLVDADTTIRNDENNLTNSETNYPTYKNQAENSKYYISDYRFMAYELKGMHEEYNEGDKEDAQEIEDELIDEIQSIYSENDSSISESEAKAIIKEQYLIINGMTIDNAEAICKEIAEQENQEDDEEESTGGGSFGDDTTNTEFDQSALYLYGVTTGDNTNNNYSGYNPHNSFQSMTYGSNYNR